MSYVTLTLIIAVVVIVYNWRKNCNNRKGLPPGPYGWPILGYLPYLGKKPHLTLTELGKKYGGLFTINLGPQPNVVITDWEIMKEAYIKQTDTFSGRPYSFAFSAAVKRKDECLYGTLSNLFVGGSETVTTATGWTFLYMAVWPEIQSKVQNEIDSVIGKNRRIAYTDRTSLPYTEAMLMEVHRFACVLGFGLTRCPLQDANLMGHRIPKGTSMIQNIWAVHFDPRLWGDPEIFRPERFLNAEGIVFKPEFYIPFSIGTRFCLGEPLARMELFMFASNLLQSFTFRCKTGEAPPSLEPIVIATFHPNPFHLRITRR